jgi:hypothetical protein
METIIISSAFSVTRAYSKYYFTQYSTKAGSINTTEILFDANGFCLAPQCLQGERKDLIDISFHVAKLNGILLKS